MKYYSYEDYETDDNLVKIAEDMAREMGYDKFIDYMDEKGLSFCDDYMYQFFKDYNDFQKSDLGDMTLFYSKSASTKIFEYAKEDEEEFIQSIRPFSIINTTILFKTAYRKELFDDETSEHQEIGKKVFKKIVDRGLNKEQISLMLLREEKAWVESIVLERKKPVEDRDEFLLKEGNKRLEEIQYFKKELAKIKSPYDRLIEVSAEISLLKSESNRISSNPKATETEYKRYEEIEEKIYLKEKWLKDELSKYDPRVVKDVINDKIESAKLELEIKYIKNDKVLDKHSQELNPIINELLPLQKQVKINIENLLKNRENIF